MKVVLSSVCLTVILCLAPPDARAQPAAALDPAKVLARVDDKPITVDKLRDLLTGAPKDALQVAKSDPKEFLAWTFMMEKLARTGEELGLDRKSPYADRIAWGRSQILMFARMEQRLAAETPSQAKAEELYRDNPHLYGTARVKLIFVSIEEGKEAEAKKKIDAAAARAAAGTDFALLARQVSEDSESAAKGGDFPEIAASSRLPEDIRRTIFRTHPGGITPVLRQPAGFYLFQVQSLHVKPLAEVSASIISAARERQSREWMEAEKKAATVKILNEKFFQTLPTTAGGKAVPSGPLSGPEVKPETELAVVNGVAMTAEHYTALIQAVPPSVRTKAVLNPTDFLKEYALMQRLAKSAEVEGLDRRMPYRNNIWYSRNRELMQAVVDDHFNRIVILPEEQRKVYQADSSRFLVANARVLYISYSLTPPPQTDPKAPRILNEAEAEAKMAGIAADARKGGDFVSLVTRFSEDRRSRDNFGLMPPFTANDGRVPEAIRKAIFAAKAGETAGPVKMPNGFYLFRIESISARQYDEVKDQILEEIRQERFQKWFTEQRDGFRISLDDPAGFAQVVNAM